MQVRIPHVRDRGIGYKNREIADQRSPRICIHPLLDNHIASQIVSLTPACMLGPAWTAAPLWNPTHIFSTPEPNRSPLANLATRSTNSRFHSGICDRMRDS
jgi:hypothetical protein